MEPGAEDRSRYGEFGRALTTAREIPPKFTQKRLGAQLGVDQTLVSAWGRGRKLSRLTRSQVTDIEQALGPQRCPPGTLLDILFGAPVTQLPRAATPEAFVSELRRLLRWWDENHPHGPPAEGGADEGERTLRPGAPRTGRTGTQGRKRQA